jgi:PIN domain nuclease of toxin-antitoxin system
LHFRFLLDTHIFVRWLIDNRKLSREQFRVLQAAVRHTEPVALSAVSLVEIAILNGQGKLKLKTSLSEFFNEMQGNPALSVLPLSYEIALETASLGILRDPADRAIVATARVHRLKLVTSDQRIIESGLVPVVA